MSDLASPDSVEDNTTSSDHEDETARLSATMAGLLREEEIGALAVLDRHGHPAVSAMHFASNGLIAYIHTFSMFRKYADLQRDGRVSYSVWHEPPAGYDGRREVRSAQVTAQATLVTDPPEVETALQVSYDQFAWLQDHDVYAGFRKARDHGAQAFFRLTPVRAVWHDARVSMSYRRLLTFTPDGTQIAEAQRYTAEVDPASALSQDEPLDLRPHT